MNCWQTLALGAFTALAGLVAGAVILAGAMKKDDACRQRLAAHPAAQRLLQAERAQDNVAALLAWRELHQAGFSDRHIADYMAQELRQEAK